MSTTVEEIFKIFPEIVDRLIHIDIYSSSKDDKNLMFEVFSNVPVSEKEYDEHMIEYNKKIKQYNKEILEYYKQLVQYIEYCDKNDMYHGY